MTLFRRLLALGVLTLACATLALSATLLHRRRTSNRKRFLFAAKRQCSLYR